MKNAAKKIIIIVILAIFLGVYYYITLPAINIHSGGFWQCLLFLAAFITVMYLLVKSGQTYRKQGIRIGARDMFREFKLAKIGLAVFVLIGDTAEILGDRKMGSMVDMVSQFEVSSEYTQINYQNTPVRVAPLVYANTIKWLTNQKQGIPAYIRIDMATQNTECVKLSSGIRYSESELFNRNIYRHLRFRYPTYIFSDQIFFEIDDEGTPYWVCPVKKFNIGLFGGQTIGKAILCNAITGACEEYDVKDVPTWVDKVYSAELLTGLYNYHGILKHGYFNSILGQKDCLQTTNGYNYIALNDDVWVYTGVTSVSGDQSNVGFVLMNQRTMETKFYRIEGAIEDSAMSSAEGQVQNLGYRATFPLLLNITDEPTYFIALKDDAGLVKKYAMVNVQKYQIVAIGDSVSQCEENYLELLLSSGVKEAEKDTRQIRTITGKITKIAQAVIDGTSHYYIMIEGSDDIFDASVVDFIDIVRCETGWEVAIEYKEDEKANVVMSLEIAGKKDAVPAVSDKDGSENEKDKTWN